MPPGRAPLLVLLLVVGFACGGAEPEADADAVAVEVEGLALDPEADSPIVVLLETDGERRLPIWIGHAEAHSIALELESRTPPRPNTHDLARRLVEGLDGHVRRIVVTELRDGVYYARIDLDRRGRDVSIDARPSDAIALGLRLEAPLFVRPELFEQGGLAEEPPRPRFHDERSERQVRGQSL